MNMSAMFTWAKCLHFGSSETVIITIKRKLRLTHSISHPFLSHVWIHSNRVHKGCHQGRRQASNQWREGCRCPATGCGCFWFCPGDEGRFCQPWSPAYSGRSQWFWSDEAGVNGCGLGGVLWPFCSGWCKCGDCSPYLGCRPWGWGRAHGGWQEVRRWLADCRPRAPHWDWDGGDLFARPREERQGAVRLFDPRGCEHGDSQGHSLGPHGAYPQAQCWRFSRGCGWTTNRWTKAGRSGACRWWFLPPDLLPWTISTCFSLRLLPTWWTFSTRSSPAVRHLPWQALDPCWGGKGIGMLHPEEGPWLWRDAWGGCRCSHGDDVPHRPHFVIPLNPHKWTRQRLKKQSHWRQKSWGRCRVGPSVW